MNATPDGAVVIVNYHYCQPLENGVFSGVKGVRPEELNRHADEIIASYRPIGLDNLISPSGAHRAVDEDAARPRLLVNSRTASDTFLFFSFMWTGMRMILDLSAIARSMACLIHQKA